LVSHNMTAEQISPIAGLRPSVVNAYVKLVQKYHPNLLSDSGKAPIGA
jgi:hypothetical protein